MRVKIYADIVFLINFFMDFFIFWILAKLIRKKVKIIRLIVGAIIAAGLYCLLLFIPYFNKVYSFLTSLFILMISTYIVYRPRKIKEFIKILILAHITAFAVGGAGMALFYFTNIRSVIGEMISVTIVNFSIKLLISTTMAIYIIIKLGYGWLNANVINKNKFCKVGVFYRDKEVELTALIDTGNSLKDPISDNHVIVAEFNGIKNLFPAEIKLMFYENENPKLEDIANEVSLSEYARRMRVIPFSSLGRENGMLLAFKPDKVHVMNGLDEEFDMENVLIGIYNKGLSKDNLFNSIVNPDIF